MWIFKQSTGQLFYSKEDWDIPNFAVITGALPADGVLVGVGYSGAGADKDIPADQGIKNMGPLPQGFYTLGPAFTDPVLGPLAMRLTPDATNQMFGRSSFLLHADSIQHPGCASEGCIVMGPAIRVAVAIHPDRRLLVIA